MDQPNEGVKAIRSDNNTPAPPEVMAMPATKRILSANRQPGRAMRVITGFLVAAIKWFMAITVCLVVAIHSRLFSRDHLMNNIAIYNRGN
jgi:hypothetical protein